MNLDTFTFRTFASRALEEKLVCSDSYRYMQLQASDSDSSLLILNMYI